MPEDMQRRITNNTNEYFKKFNSNYKLKYIKYEDNIQEIDFYKIVYEGLTTNEKTLNFFNCSVRSSTCFLDVSLAFCSSVIIFTIDS
jgi:hypothetical protein